MVMVINGIQDGGVAEVQNYWSLDVATKGGNKLSIKLDIKLCLWRLRVFYVGQLPSVVVTL